MTKQIYLNILARVSRRGSPRNAGARQDVYSNNLDPEELQLEPKQNVY